MPLLYVGLCPFLGLYWLICRSSAVGLQLQGPPPLLPLDELCHSLGVPRCCSSLVNPLQGHLLHPSCLMLEKTVPDVFCLRGGCLVKPVGGVISFPKDEQSCKTEPQVTPGISLQALPLNFKILRKKPKNQPKNQLGDWRLLLALTGVPLLLQEETQHLH